MVQRWGKLMPLMKYTRENLGNLILKAQIEGGLKTLKRFQDFSTKVDTIVNYLVRCKHMASVEEIRHSWPLMDLTLSLTTRSSSTT